MIDKKITILAHYENTGATEELRDWLIKKKAREVVYIAFPFLDCISKSVDVFVYRDGKLAGLISSSIRFNKPSPLSYVKDFFYGILYGMMYARNSDIIVCGDNLLSIVGVLLKKFNCVKTVIYYMIDYMPVRYKNKILNLLYWTFDKIAAYNVDRIWPLNIKTLFSRIESGKLSHRKIGFKYTVMPYGTHIKQSKSYDKYRVVYFGSINKYKGTDILPGILYELKKINKKYNMIVIGGNSFGHTSRDGIEMLGRVGNYNRILEIMSHCGVAVAPYPTGDMNNIAYYTDSGKIKAYLGCGLPVVTTSTPPVSELLRKSGSGLVADYDCKDIARKINAIVKDYKCFKATASAVGRLYDWGIIFGWFFYEIGKA